MLALNIPFANALVPTSLFSFGAIEAEQPSCFRPLSFVITMKHSAMTQDQF
jgi:hypothetical protein